MQKDEQGRLYPDGVTLNDAGAFTEVTKNPDGTLTHWYRTPEVDTQGNAFWREQAQTMTLEDFKAQAEAERSRAESLARSADAMEAAAARAEQKALAG